MTADKRWQIITFDNDGGADEKQEYFTLDSARTAAREYKRDYSGVIIYDKFQQRIHDKRGCWPAGSLPLYFLTA